MNPKKAYGSRYLNGDVVSVGVMVGREKLAAKVERILSYSSYGHKYM